MDNNHKMIVWSSAWALIGGIVVCTGCMHGQALSDSGEEFKHEPDCKALGEVAKHAWSELHSILDDERG